MSQEAILQEISGLLRSQGARLDFLVGRTNADTRSFNAQLSSSSNNLSRFSSGTNSAIGSIVDFGMAAASGHARLQDFYSAFNSVPILNWLSGPAAGLMEYGSQLLYSYRDLTRSGAGFGGSLKDMMVSVAESRLSMEQYNAMVRINAETFASAPGGIDQGINTFVKAQQTLMGSDSPLRRELLALGYTAEDTAVFLGDIMRRQGNMSVRGALDANQLSEATAAYARELDMVSKITGKRKEQIAEELRKSTEDAFFKRAQMGMDQTQRMLSDKFMAQATMLGPDMVQLMQLVMSGADPVGTPEYQRMMVQTEGAAQEMLNVARSAMQNRDANASLLPSMVKASTAYGNLADQVGFTTIATMKSRGDSLLYNQEMLNFANRVKHLTDQGMSEDRAAAQITEEARAAQARQLAEGKNQAAELANAEASIRDFGQQLTILTSNILPDLIGGLANFSTKVLGAVSGTIKDSQEAAQKMAGTVKTELVNFGEAVKTGNVEGMIKSGNKINKDFENLYSTMTTSLLKNVGGGATTGGTTTTTTPNRPGGAPAPPGTPAPPGAPAAPAASNEPPSIYTEVVRKLWAATKQEMVDGASSTMGAVKDSFTNNINGLFNTINSSVRERIGLPPAGRADGGATTPGSYLVGERGPEVLNLGTPGDVISNDNLTKMLASTSNQNGMKESIDQLNTTNSQMLAAIRELVQINDRTLTATRGLNGNLFAA